MTAFVIGVISETRFGDDIRTYLQRIDSTLAPFSGRFRIHGGPYQSLEGSWSSDLIVIEFPSRTQAESWYSSDAYKAIRPLRVNNTEGVVFLVEGVPEDHKATDILE